MSNSKLGKIIAVLTAAAIAVLGILFIIFAAHLYFTGGERPYSRDRVGEYLLPLLIPSLITVGLSIWGLVYYCLKGIREKESASVAPFAASAIFLETVSSLS